METTQILKKIMKHGENNCTYDDQEGYISYNRIAEISYKNITELRKAGLTSSEVILVDVTLGWRIIPIFISCLFSQVTVIPIDNNHQKKLSDKILNDFKNAPYLAKKVVSEDGIINYDALKKKDRFLEKELEDVAFILYTSGTTGLPKGVMLTFLNIWSNAQSIMEVLNLRETDRLLIIRPLINASAITGELLPALIAGCELHIKPFDMQPLGAINLIQKHNITFFCTTPTILLYLLPFLKRKKLNPKLRIFLSGEPLTAFHIKSFKESLPNVEVWNGYGLTESSPRISILNKDISDYQEGCVGYPLKGIEVKVIDEIGQPLDSDQLGELIVSGPNVMKGYYKDQNASKEKIIDGWLYTSDLATIKNGMLYVYGRKDEMINKGGVNISPREIENFLMRHSDINEALVFGEKNKKYQVKIHAWIVVKNMISPEDIYLFLKDEGLDSFLWPDIIQVKSSLPKTSSGKLVRISN